jgi:hypothetical protein
MDDHTWAQVLLRDCRPQLGIAYHDAVARGGCSLLLIDAHDLDAPLSVQARSRHDGDPPEVLRELLRSRGLEVVPDGHVPVVVLTDEGRHAFAVPVAGLVD